jgi:hypothetical protein
MGSTTVDETLQFIASLVVDPDKEAVGAEMSALQSIYGENSLELWKDSQNIDSIRYQVTMR